MNGNGVNSRKKLITSFWIYLEVPLTLQICLPRLPQISDTLSLVKEILQQLTNQRASIEEDIQSSFEDLHKQLDVRKSVLLMELEVTYGLKQKVRTSIQDFPKTRF